MPQRFLRTTAPLQLLLHLASQLQPLHSLPLKLVQLGYRVASLLRR